MAASSLAYILLINLIASAVTECILGDAGVSLMDWNKAEIKPVWGSNKVGNNDGLLETIFNVALAQNCVDPPDFCPNENITFWLFTRSMQENPSIINVSDSKSLKSLKFVKGYPWKLIIHGYTGHRDFSPNSELRPAYFEKGEYNIISIDYGPLVREPCYLQSVMNVPLVANCTAYMIDKMVEEEIFQLNELHVIGFSLGGQVSGHLSRFLKSGTLSRITGLDPALPLFIGNALGKLDESDAEFVDVIHTDAGRKGKLERSGHADFYPNGGYSQIGCLDTENFSGGMSGAGSRRDLSHSRFWSFAEESESGRVLVYALSGCNHVRASYYYAESILSEKGFWGIPCSTYLAFYWGWCRAKESDLVIMGEYTPSTASGTYYLETNKYPPYALGKVSKIKYSRENLKEISEN